jgi:16S rRNA (cytosine967-C5)-methyltransferase
LTPGAQVAAAIDVLAAIDTGEWPADEVAADYFRRRRYIGAKDRAQIAGHIYSVLRHRPALDWWITKHAVEIAPRSRVLAALALTESWRPETIGSCCDGDRFRPARLSQAEDRMAHGLAKRTLRDPEMPRAVVNGLPEWLLPNFERVFGEELEREMAALNAEAPIDLRVNLLKADREAARRQLSAEGVAAKPTPWSSIGLRLMERVPLGGLAAVKDGLVEVQDEGSQIAALLVDARPGMRVVDFCAGAGGKTLALAAQMANRGKLVACDVSARRLEKGSRRLRRAGVGNAERRPLTSERDKWVKRHAGRFDRVLVDAPCLGTGTWRRNPGDKWRVTPEGLAGLIDRQQQILNSAARLVGPGGRLVYATCSVLHEENEAQAEAFLAASPEFSIVPATNVWHEAIGGIAPGGEPYLRLTPARHGTDGFFVAIFERQPCQTGS